MPPRSRSVISGSRSSIGRDARKAFQVEGLAEIQANLARVIDGVTGKQAKQVYFDAGKVLRDKARDNAPYDPGRTTGTHLRDAIFVTRGDESKPNVLVGVRYGERGAPHAHWVEYGTSKMQPQPYFRPAMVQVGVKIASTIKDGLLGIIQKATK